jgi:hypothetical protein
MPRERQLLGPRRASGIALESHLLPSDTPKDFWLTLLVFGDGQL